MASLRQKQNQFAGMFARLILFAQSQGYEVTLGETFRPEREAAQLAKEGKGIGGSLHTMRLAGDLNLFRDGIYLTETHDYLPIGEQWETMGGAWGGRFAKSDGNHFSLAHDGKR